MNGRVGWSLLLLVAACTQLTETNPAATSPAANPADVPQPSPGASVVLTPALPGQSGGEEGWIDSTSDYGLIEPLTGMHGHAAAWGDVDGDATPDLIVGTFADRPRDVYAVRGANGAAADTLLSGSGTAFTISGSFGLGRTSGAALADLDGDRDLDLVLARNVKDPSSTLEHSAIFENRAGQLFEVDDSGLGPDLGGRSVGVLDHDGDGRLDLFVVEDRYAGGSSRLLRNLGGLRFSDITEASGLPDDIEGLGVAVVDLSGDGRPDLFVSGSNRLFVSEDGRYSEVVSGVFEWEVFGDEDLVAGVAAGDVDRDGRLDLVVGHHYNSTVDDEIEVPVRLYLNRSKPGEVEFIDVTDTVGLSAIPTKAPHVQIADVDNDGWPDIVTSASAGNGSVPAVFRHLGLVDGMPRFEPPSGLGSNQYWVTAPLADVDGDLRLDIIAIEWEPALPSRLFLNAFSSGGALIVGIDDPRGGGVGYTVSVFEAGMAGDPEALIGFTEIVASVGYAAGVEPRAHFGLGDRVSADVVVTAPFRDPIVLESVPSDHTVVIEP